MSGTCKIIGNYFNCLMRLLLIVHIFTHLSVGVEHGEVGHYHWHREGNDKDTGQGTQRAHDDACIGLGHHVTVTHCCHCHYGPPEAFRYTFEIVFRVCMKSFCIVN